MRTVIEGPLLVRADGTSSLRAAKDVVRVSDHYSACFVTRSAEVACWGVTSGGGTWNGVAKRDADVGLHDIVDVAINQTGACALNAAGAVSCWGDDGRPVERALPGPAREIMVSVAGRACALLRDGTVAGAASWKEGRWDRVANPGLEDVAHLLACDPGLVCGERARGGGACLPLGKGDDVRRGVPDEQRRVLSQIDRVPQGMHLAMNDIGTAFCAYSDAEVRCFHGKSGTTSVVTGLSSITEVAVGWSVLGGKRADTTACARIAGDDVRCWNLAEANPTPVPVR
jgi:hypothetical protein